MNITRHPEIASGGWKRCLPAAGAWSYAILVCLLLAWCWRDSQRTRTGAVLHTPCGTACMVHHGGKLDLIWSDAVIVPGAPQSFLFFTARTAQPAVAGDGPCGFACDDSPKGYAAHLGLPYRALAIVPLCCAACLAGGGIVLAFLPKSRLGFFL